MTALVPGALIAERGEHGWQVQSLGAPHIGERSEAELLQSFVGRVDALRPLMVTFNGSSFDLPVLRYRSMIHRVRAPGLEGRRYWYRYSDDSVDLCDVLSSFNAAGKVRLHDLCRALCATAPHERISAGLAGSDSATLAPVVALSSPRNGADFLGCGVVAHLKEWLASSGISDPDQRIAPS